MAHPCASCTKQFPSAASLNFHVKKAHVRKRLPVDCESINAIGQDNNEAPRRSNRGRPPILKFGKIPGVADFSKGPFKVSQITLKITEEKEEALGEKRPGRNSCPPSSEPDVGFGKSKPRKRKLIRRKASPDVATDGEDKTPPRVSSTTPEMPVLSPQSSPIRRVGGRPGPKRSKQGKHWKYNQGHGDEDTFSSMADNHEIVRPSKKISWYSDGTASSVSNNSRPESRTSERSISNAASLSAIEEKGEKIRLSGSSQHSTTSSVVSEGNSWNNDKSPSKDNGQSQSSSPVFKHRKSPVRSKLAMRPLVSGRTQPCPICKKTGFRNPNHYTNHLEIHEGRRPYLCPDPVCGMGYETEMKLLEHVTIRHCQEAKFTCPGCGVDYKTQRGLENHKCV